MNWRWLNIHVLTVGMSWVCLTISGCGKENIVVVEKDGLIIMDKVIGEGAEASRLDIVTVHYTGQLENETVFDSSRKPGREPFRFTLGVKQVIEGWDRGVAGMRVGGVRRLTIPPSLGYGSQGAGTVILPNATLIFDVELLAVESVY